MGRGMESPAAEARQQLVVVGQEVDAVLHPGRDLEVGGERSARRAPPQLGGRAGRFEAEQRELEAAAHHRAHGEKAGASSAT